MYDDPAPVHDINQTVKEWLNDELTWTDVYSKKPVEYLEAIARGETPRWDSEKGGYVYENNSQSTSIMGSPIDPQSDDMQDPDLPF
jgi:hypothetical protein